MTQTNDYILALDQGTTSSRAMLFDKKGQAVAKAHKNLKQYFPKSGWVEHDPVEIWTSQASVILEVITLADILPSQIAALGITNQRETTIIWDRETGSPVYPAIVWQDRRTSGYCNELKKQGLSEKINEKTGLVIDAYFSATKIKWILDKVDGARAKAEKGEICFGTVDSWLVWKLSNGREHITDITNASRTMLFNIHDKQWDEELLELFDIPRAILPAVKSSSEVYCNTAGDILSAQIPVAGIAGDQQAALFGQLCVQQGMAKTTYGTGCFLVMNTGDKPVKSKNKLLTTIAWQIGDKVQYALEGSVFVGGAGIQWLRDEVGLFAHSSESEALATSIPDNDGVYFVPALTGLGAPYWDQEARGAFFGLTRGTTKAHLVRAGLEAIAFQVYDVLKAMEKDSKEKTLELRVDGGASRNNFLMQFQADLIRGAIRKPKYTETTALGAAYLAGLAVGYWDGIAELEGLWGEGAAFYPQMDQKVRERKLHYWHKAVDRSREWIEDENPQ